MLLHNWLTALKILHRPSWQLRHRRKARVYSNHFGGNVERVRRIGIGPAA